MDHRIASARLKGRARTATMIAWGLAAAVSLAGASALAQTPQKKPAVPQKQAPATQPAPQAGAAPQQPPPALLYSSWMKVCNKNASTNNKQVCTVFKDGRLENGRPIVAVQLIEPEGQAKLLRVIVPLGTQIRHGTRVIIDQSAPLTEPYAMCIPLGCMSDYPVTDEMIKQLKKGKQIVVQAINFNNTPISLPLPLADFAKAYEGPATDPKVFEAQQQKLQSELQKKAEAARKKLEAQQPAAPAPK